MRLMLALITFLLSESLKEVSLCAKIFGSVERILFKTVCLRNVFCIMEKEVNGRLDTITATTLKVYRNLKILFKYMLFQMTMTNSKTCMKFNTLWPV